MKFYPPTIAYFLIIIFGILGFFYGKFIYYPFNLLGIVVLVIGFWVMMKSHNLFIKNKTGVAPHEKTIKFIQQGPYIFSRNPMYLGFILIMIGISVLIGSYITLIAPVLFAIIMNYTWIPFEERRMKKQFGEDYIEYKKKVRRWI
jgi:protein-S-isoprenylcysteine O-methyltransferase Ste14